MIGIIVAVSPRGIIGVDGKIPWHYRGDFKRFKEKTLNTTVIMGRKTWESIGKALPDRRNIVISTTLTSVNGGDVFPDIQAALSTVKGDVWFIGGRGIYQEALDLADVIDITYIPDQIEDSPNAVYFPSELPGEWEPGRLRAHEYEEKLRCRELRRSQR